MLFNWKKGYERRKMHSLVFMKNNGKLKRISHHAHNCPTTYWQLFKKLLTNLLPYSLEQAQELLWPTQEESRVGQILRGFSDTGPGSTALQGQNRPKGGSSFGFRVQALSSVTLLSQQRYFTTIFERELVQTTFWFFFWGGAVFLSKVVFNFFSFLKPQDCELTSLSLIMSCWCVKSIIWFKVMKGTLNIHYSPSYYPQVKRIISHITSL